VGKLRQSKWLSFSPRYKVKHDANCRLLSYFFLEFLFWRSTYELWFASRLIYRIKVVQNSLFGTDHKKDVYVFCKQAKQKLLSTYERM